MPISKPAAKKPAAKKPAAKKPPAKKPAAKKPAAKKPAAKKPMATKAPAAPRRPMARADFGKPVDAWFGKQSAPLRPIVETLRDLVNEVAPDATGSLKWGMPFYEVAGGMMCAITAHKSHANLVLSGSPEMFPDPKGLLEGDGKTGRRLKVAPGAVVPKDAVRKWLKAAAMRARGGGKMR